MCVTDKLVKKVEYLENNARVYKGVRYFSDTCTCTRCVWWQSYMCMYNILLKHLSSTSSSCCIYRYCREGKSNDEFPQSCGGRTQRYVCVLALAGMCVPVSLYTFSLSLSLDLGTAFVNIGMYEPQQSASVAFTDFGNAHK